MLSTNTEIHKHFQYLLCENILSIKLCLSQLKHHIAL